jgi:homopolymeric O-antigen transport system permease protein
MQLTATSRLPETPLLTIKPTTGWVSIGFNSIWAYRDLLYFLAWRDVKIRYKQTALGVTWAVLQPLLTMIILTLLFGKVARIPSDGHPYAVFAYAGLLPWTFFANAITNSGGSLVLNSSLISKVYFPRLVMPSAAVLAGLVDFAVSLVILFGLFIVYGVAPTWGLLVLPFLVLLTVILAVGVGSYFAALNVKYRDIRYALPFAVQLLMFATPIIYPSSMVPVRWRWALWANPMAGIVESFRSCLLGRAFDWPLLGLATTLTVAIFLCGSLYFRSVEKGFADIV